MINTLSKIHLSKIGWEGGGSTSIWIMSLNILGGFLTLPLTNSNLAEFLVQRTEKYTIRGGIPAEDQRL